MRWFGLSSASIPESQERFARRYRNEPTPEFSLIFPCSSIIHLFSGVNASRNSGGNGSPRACSSTGSVTGLLMLIHSYSPFVLLLDS